MAARQRRSQADRRRRSHSQNFLVDPHVVQRLIRRARIEPGERIVDLGAGAGALTIPLARAGASVLAVERDKRWVATLQQRIVEAEVADRVQIRRGDLRAIPLPREPYRVIASPPYALTTTLLKRLLDDPVRGPYRADVLVQLEVARKRAAQPAETLLSAAWQPWWRFELGETVSSRAFRPVPACDSAWLHIERRDPPLLPMRLAGSFYNTLSAQWNSTG